MNKIYKIWRICCFVVWQGVSYCYLTILRLSKREPEGQQHEDMNNSEKKVVYLTFDDGPSPYTRQLLKILNRYHVKATFFVTGNGDPEIILDIVSSGHSIGNHTASHKYKEIYSSEEHFYEDFYKMDDIIAKKTGIHTRIMRFPGGSSNTCSRFNEKIMTRLADSVQKKGYGYFDWNVDSGDAGNARTPGKVYRNVINGIRENDVSIVLQHDTRLYSVVTVQRIIIWGLKHGYVFCPLSTDSPTVHHQINN